jgi:hypothetical protein
MLKTGRTPETMIRCDEVVVVKTGFLISSLYTRLIWG